MTEEEYKQEQKDNRFMTFIFVAAFCAAPGLYVGSQVYESVKAKKEAKQRQEEQELQNDSIPFAKAQEFARAKQR